MRSKVEIDEMIRRGEAFVKKCPQTIFGQDNSKALKLMRKIFEDYQSGKSINDLYDMTEYLDDDDSLFAGGVIEWLDGDDEQEPYSKSDAE